MLFSRTKSLNQSRKVLQSSNSSLQASSSLSENVRSQWKEKLLSLQAVIDSGDKKLASDKAKELEQFTKNHTQQTIVKKGFEVVLALGVALLVAVVVRSMWFELYEIPTGSMRPTFKEQDHLTVSKTQFGINVPLKTEHFYFEPNLVQRTSTIVFSGDGLPLPDTDTTFLGVFPYKKRYVKRMIGRPEDTLYFYGGKIYALDKEQKPVEEFLNTPWMAPLEHVPFLQFADSVRQGKGQSYILTYFNKPYGRVTQNLDGTLTGEIFDGKSWIPDHLEAAGKPHTTPQTLSDFFGIRNFAIVEIATKEQLEKEGLKTTEKAPLYLIFHHTPHLDYTKGPSFSPRFPKTLKTVLPLDEQGMKTLMDNLYTARFVVKGGKVARYSHEQKGANASSPALDVPDGTYEFYYGKGYEVLFGGLTKELPKDHPLYTISPERVQLLFNLGIGWDLNYMPKPGHPLPNRYGYFRNGDLYVMGAPLLKKSDPRLEKFVKEEKEKESAATKNNPYIPFIDQGPPEQKQIVKFGLQVPKKEYMVLGDNHAMSGDSRIFGFVPEANLQGVPEIILWPFGDRIGYPEQKPYPTFVTPRLIVWALAAITSLICYLIYRYRLRKRIQ